MTGVVTEDGLSILLARIEHLAAEAARLKRLDRSFSGLAEERDRLTRDLKTAEAKVREWGEYASQLRAVINPITLKRKNIVLPDPPAALETEIPF